MTKENTSFDILDISPCSPQAVLKTLINWYNTDIQKNHTQKHANGNNLWKLARVTYGSQTDINKYTNRFSPFPMKMLEDGSLLAQRKLRQRYVFTCVANSVDGGVPQPHPGRTQQRDKTTPQEEIPPWEHTPTRE